MNCMVLAGNYLDCEVPGRGRRSGRRSAAELSPEGVREVAHRGERGRLLAAGARAGQLWSTDGGGLGRGSIIAADARSNGLHSSKGWTDGISFTVHPQGPGRGLAHGVSVVRRRLLRQMIIRVVSADLAGRPGAAGVLGSCLPPWLFTTDHAICRSSFHRRSLRCRASAKFQLQCCTVDILASRRPEWPRLPRRLHCLAEAPLLLRPRGCQTIANGHEGPLKDLDCRLAAACHVQDEGAAASNLIRGKGLLGVQGEGLGGDRHLAGGGNRPPR
jgi:hypothetical protein